MSSPGAGFPVITTVADFRFVSSESVMPIDPSIVTGGCPSMKSDVPPEVVTTGGSIVSATDNVLLDAVLVAMPSLTSNEIVRFPTVGFWAVLN